jgi:hypothetical protein
MLQNLVFKCNETLVTLEFKPISIMTKSICPDPPRDPELIPFPRLKTLIFHYGHFDSVLDKQTFRIFNDNMKFLLGTLSCPALRVLNITPETSVLIHLLQSIDDINPAYLKWESMPLKKFVHDHRYPLREVDICLYRTLMTPEKEEFKPPRNLHEYSVAAPCLETGLPIELHKGYWQRILSKQTSLTKLTAQAELWGTTEKLFSFLKVQLCRVQQNRTPCVTANVNVKYLQMFLI